MFGFLPQEWELGLEVEIKVYRTKFRGRTKEERETSFPVFESNCQSIKNRLFAFVRPIRRRARKARQIPAKWVKKWIIDLKQIDF